jgi:hypothetical protein
LPTAIALESAEEADGHAAVNVRLGGPELGAGELRQAPETAGETWIAAPGRA